MAKKFFYFAVIFLLNSNFLKCQEYIWSNFSGAPLLLNPAYTGYSVGDWRLATNYRVQWSKLASPYRSLNASFENKFTYYQAKLGIGINLLSDELSRNGLRNYTSLISLAWHIQLRNSNLHVALQPGVSFYHLSDKELTKPDQFNYTTGYFDNNLPSNEITFEDHKSFMDLNAGALWEFSFLNFNPTLGISLYHLNRPDIRFSDESEQNREKIRPSLYFKLPLPINSLFSSEVSSYTSFIGKARMYINSAGVKLNANRYSNLIEYTYLNASLRNGSAKNLNALIFTLGLKIKMLEIAFSYDEYPSRRRTLSGLGETYEISIILHGVNTAFNQYTVPCERF